MLTRYLHTLGPRLREPDARRLAILLFIAAQIGIPVVATIIHWFTGRETWWGWQMFSS